MSDADSRYLLLYQAVGRADLEHVWPHLARAFADYGLPKAMRSDNGPPFASRAVGGLSRLAVRLIKAGVMPERIAPGKPQENGRHERFHLTLKQETASPSARSLRAQIERPRAGVRGCSCAGRASKRDGSAAADLLLPPRPRQAD